MKKIFTIKRLTKLSRKYSAEFGKLYGIRDLTATREVGFAKLWNTGLGKKMSIQDSDERSSGCGIVVFSRSRNTRSVPPPSPSPFLDPSKRVIEYNND